MHEHISWVTAMRLFANLLTATTASAWLKFADTREGVLSSPNLHHRVYLRVLIGLSFAAFVCGIVSLAAAAYVDTRFKDHASVSARAPHTPGNAPPADGG